MSIWWKHIRPTKLAWTIVVEKCFHRCEFHNTSVLTQFKEIREFYNSHNAQLARKARFVSLFVLLLSPNCHSRSIRLILRPLLPCHGVLMQDEALCSESNSQVQGKGDHSRVQPSRFQGWSGRDCLFHVLVVKKTNPQIHPCLFDIFGLTQPLSFCASISPR